MREMIKNSEAHQGDGQVGEVIATSGDFATIKVERHGACKHCGACFLGKGDDQSTEFALRNTVNAEVGDRVVIDIEGKALVKASIFLYLIPVAALVIGMLVGHQYLAFIGLGENAVSVLTGAVFLGAALLILRWYDRALKESDKASYQPVIVKKLDAQQCDGE